MDGLGGGGIVLQLLGELGVVECEEAELSPRGVTTGEVAAMVGEVKIVFDGVQGGLKLLGDEPLRGAPFDGRDDALTQIDGVGAHTGPPFPENQHMPVYI